MAIIYTYPTKATPNDNDLILISDSEDSNKTKQVKISSLPGGTSSGVSSVTATLPVVSSGGNTPVISLTGLTGFGTAGQVIKVNSGADGLEWGAAGGSTSPGGSNTQVQFNNNSAFDASANLTFSTNTLAVTHTVDIKGDGTNAGKLKLYCPNTTTPHAVTLEGPVHPAVAYTLKMPAAAPGTSQILEYENSTNNLRWIATPTSSGATPAAGATGQVQYNDGSNGFAASANITIGGTPNVLTVKNIVQTRGDGTNAGKFKIWSNDNLKHVSIEGPPNGGTDYELKMPNTIGTANQVLKLPSTIPGSGASQLAWGDATGGVTYTFSTGLSESGGTVTLDAGLNNLTNVSFATGANGSLYVGQISSAPATGLSNVTLGGGAGKVMSSGTDNTLIGSDSASLLTVASHNVIVGSDSAAAITEGGDNVLIGSDVAATLTTGTDNVVIGKGADVSAGSVRSVIIGEGASGNNDSVVVGQGSSAASTSIVLGKDVNITGNNKLAIGAIALNTTGYETQTYYLPIQIKNTSTGYMDQYYIKLWT